MNTKKQPSKIKIPTVAADTICAYYHVVHVRCVVENVKWSIGRGRIGMHTRRGATKKQNKK